MATRGVNKAMILGNLGADPEMRYMPNGHAVANLRIATGEVWKDDAGATQERTEWHNVVLYRRIAEVAAQYLRKGSKVYIEGSLRTRKWQDKNTGQDRYSTEIVGSELQMLDGKHASGAGNESGSERTAKPSGAYSASATAGGADDADFDDVPF